MNENNDLEFAFFFGIRYTELLENSFSVDPFTLYKDTVMLNQASVVQHQGREFFKTGKEGHRFFDGVHGFEYSCQFKLPEGDLCENRLWVYDDGSRDLG
jgi:hypothetical protein